MSREMSDGMNAKMVLTSYNKNKYEHITTIKQNHATNSAPLFCS